MTFADTNSPRKIPVYPASAGRPRNADREARLANLLDTAETLFLEKGYGNVSLEAIAREARVAVRTIYVKFGGKAGLLKAVIVEGRSRYFAGMSDMETDQRTIAEALTDFSVRFVEQLSQPGFIALHRMVIAEAQTTPELALAFYLAGPLQTRQQLSRFFGRPEIASQLRSDLPPDALSLHLLNCLLGDQVTRILFDEEMPRDEAQIRAEVVARLKFFFHGVRSAKP
jgi:AcrR family transcriptional regulator